MKYILDFDETIFNAKKFKQILRDCSIDENFVSGETFDEIKTKLPDFDISSLLFQDAIDFLRAHVNDCEIVSSFLSVDPAKNYDEEKRRSYQAQKIALSGVTELLGSNHVHLVGDSKMEKLQELKQVHEDKQEQCVFVDDNPEWIEQAESIGMRAFTMKREHAVGTFENFFGILSKNSVSSFEGFNERVTKEAE